MKIKIEGEPRLPSEKDSTAEYARSISKFVGGSFKRLNDLWDGDGTRIQKMQEIVRLAYQIDHLDVEDVDRVYAFILYNFCLAQWEQDGLNVFDVTASLMAGLLLTTPSDEPLFPRLPFDSFHVRIPDGFIPIYVRDKEETTTRWVKMIRVNLYDHDESGVPRTVLKIAGSDETGQIPDLGHTIFKHEFVSVAAEVALIVNDFSVPYTIDGGRGKSDADDAVTQQLIFLVVANLCAWLESVGGLKGKRPDNAGAMNRQDKAKIAQWIVGREVKLSKEVIQAARDRAQGVDPKRRTTSWHLSYQHTVRGHWRWQACGEKHQERKRIWIMPHRHGPKEGDVAAHVYKLSK